MGSKSSIFKDIPFETVPLGKASAKIPLSAVFAEREDSYINEYMLFIAHFNVIPNVIQEVNIDCKKATTWFMATYKNDIKNYYYSRLYHNKNSPASEYQDIFYFVYNDVLAYFDTANSVVSFLFRNTEIEKIETLIKGVNKFKRGRMSGKSPHLFLLVNSFMGLDTKSLGITKPQLTIEDNYNDDFREIHNIILKRLRKMNDKGLVLLHGKPGTGKTSYIRYLVSMVKKDVIFFPPNMTYALTSPDLLSLMIKNRNSVFVIEDAENILIDREIDGRSPVSTLLNISDGLLADCLNIQVICSFNTDLTKVDSALMRKGRLIATYEFKELEIPQAQKLSDKLGFTTECTTPMTLTAIYNQDERAFCQNRNGNPVGFRVLRSN